MQLILSYLLFSNQCLPVGFGSPKRWSFEKDFNIFVFLMTFSSPKAIKFIELYALGRSKVSIKLP